MQPNAAAALKRLRELSNPRDAQFLQRFFRTGPGEYGEGDRFLGIRVPATRALARELRGMPLDQIEQYLDWLDQTRALRRPEEKPGDNGEGKS